MQMNWRDPGFLAGEAARPLRILAEYLGPHSIFSRGKVKDTIVFFGSARQRPDGPFARYLHEARALAEGITRWSLALDPEGGRYVVCTGGGGGIMAAANQGAHDAGGRSIGLNISLPQEQEPNPHITHGLGMGFHYFFMRKLWFAHLARALVYFPGGYGTLDELFELLTLAQTGKLVRMPLLLLYGSAYWDEIIDFHALVRHGMIAPEDLALFRRADDPETALRILQQSLPEGPVPPGPAFVESVDSTDQGRP